MQLVRRAYRRLQAFLTGAAIEQDMDDEMRLHMDLLAEDYERSGMSREAASRAARRRFGNLSRIQEQSRDIRGAGILEDLKRDLLYAARTLRRSPIFTAVVTLSLALGIGANTSLFTVIDAAVLRKLPVETPDELVFFRWTSGQV
jgi:putative ABC transport system permease protein